MINRPNNWDNVEAKSGDKYPQLPPDGYIVEIKKAETKKAASGYEYLDLSIDIAEGEHAGYYSNEYRSNPYDNKTYKGHFRQGLPNTEEAAGYFKAMITAIEESNPGYTWNWDEQSLVGLKVGCIFRSEEWEYNGFTGLRTAAFRMTAADKIRNKEYTVPDPKLLNKAAPAIPAGFETIQDDDIPF